VSDDRGGDDVLERREQPVQLAGGQGARQRGVTDEIGKPDADQPAGGDLVVVGRPRVCRDPDEVGLERRRQQRLE